MAKKATEKEENGVKGMEAQVTSTTHDLNEAVQKTTDGEKEIEEADNNVGLAEHLWVSTGDNYTGKKENVGNCFDRITQGRNREKVAEVLINKVKNAMDAIKKTTNGATTEEEKAKDALTKILKGLEDAIKAKHASRVLVASAKTTEFITTMESYKEVMLGKQKRATQMISAMKSAHDNAPNDVKESVAPKITDAQNALQSITEAMKKIHTAHVEVTKRKAEIDRAMTDTAVSDVSDAASKAQEAERAANAAAEQIVKAHEAHQRALEATQLVESIQTDVSNRTNTTKEKVNVPLSGKETREHTTENAVEEKDNSLHENTNHYAESSNRNESEETISTDYTNDSGRIGGKDHVGKSITAKLSDSSS